MRDLHKVFVPVFVFVSLYKSPGAAVSNEGWGCGTAATSAPLFSVMKTSLISS